MGRRWRAGLGRRISCGSVRNDLQSESRHLKSSEAWPGQQRRTLDPEKTGAGRRTRLRCRCNMKVVMAHQLSVAGATKG
jgi:hypothetical protein